MFRISSCSPERQTHTHTAFGSSTLLLLLPSRSGCTTAATSYPHCRQCTLLLSLNDTQTLFQDFPTLRVPEAEAAEPPMSWLLGAEQLPVVQRVQSARCKSCFPLHALCALHDIYAVAFQVWVCFFFLFFLQLLLKKRNAALLKNAFLPTSNNPPLILFTPGKTSKRGWVQKEGPHCTQTLGMDGP